MKTIEILHGFKAMVDDIDYEHLNQFNWYPSQLPKDTPYAIGSKKINGKWVLFSMHREIMNAEKGIYIDHKDGNRLNNQRDNLRVCTPSQNQKNKKPSGSSRYLGVSRHTINSKYLSKKTKKYTLYTSSAWISHINVGGKGRHLGSFKTELEAAIIYNIAARKYHGEFARPNKFN